jgi:hypothetical protein
MTEFKDDQECISHWISKLTKEGKYDDKDQIIAIAYSKCGKSKKDGDPLAWMRENIVFDSATTLNNVMKVPVILAREMIQLYKNGTEKHFKPYDELVKSIDLQDELPIIIEHKRWGNDDVVGYVRELKKNDDSRDIRGTAYITTSKIPEGLTDRLNKKFVVPVSIGFWADVGDSGEFNGEKYDHVQKDMVMNHLAICMNSIARCPPEFCGLNLDSNESSLVTEERLIKKGNEYYYIFKEDLEEKEKNIKIQEIGDNMGDIRNFGEEKYHNLPHENPKSTAPSKQLATANPASLAVLKTLLDWCQYFPEGAVREDAISLLQSLMYKEEPEMGDSEELAKLESRIKELEDSLKEKDNLILDFEKEKKTELIGTIKKFSLWEDSELAEKCLHDLQVIADAVSKFEPSMAKPKKVPKKKPTAEEVEDARLGPDVWDGTYNEDEE